MQRKTTSAAENTKADLALSLSVKSQSGRASTKGSKEMDCVSSLLCFLRPLSLVVSAVEAREGDSIPSVEFKARVIDLDSRHSNPFKWKCVTTEDLFRGKRSVLFAVHGAFTPACSVSHLPGYRNNYELIKSLGIDEVYCISVNDAFVMRQWVRI